MSFIHLDYHLPPYNMVPIITMNSRSVHYTSLHLLMHNNHLNLPLIILIHIHILQNHPIIPLVMNDPNNISVHFIYSIHLLNLVPFLTIHIPFMSYLVLMFMSMSIYMSPNVNHYPMLYLYVLLISSLNSPFLLLFLPIMSYNTGMPSILMSYPSLTLSHSNLHRILLALYPNMAAVYLYCCIHESQNTLHCTSALQIHNHYTSYH